MSTEADRLRAIPGLTFTATKIGDKKWKLVEIAGLTGTFGDLKRWAAICYPNATIKKVTR